MHCLNVNKFSNFSSKLKALPAIKATAITLYSSLPSTLNNN